MMEWLQELRIVHSLFGLVHTILAVAAMVFGSVVLLRPKGDKRHVRIGYAYFWSMIFMNLTAFGIYNFGGFSLFHGFAIFSLLTLAAGVYPAVKRSMGWYPRHYYFMSWSVVGLYCAFWSEVGTRLLDMQYFWWAVMLASLLTAGIGAVVIQVNAKKLKFN